MVGFLVESPAKEVDGGKVTRQAGHKPHAVAHCHRRACTEHAQERRALSPGAVLEPYDIAVSRQ